MVLAVSRIIQRKLQTAGRRFAGPGTLAGGLPTRSGDTMNALANDIEAMDLARHSHTLAAPCQT